MNKLSRFAGYGIEDIAATGELPPVDENTAPEQLEAEAEVAENDVEKVEGDITEMEDVAESLEAICQGIEFSLKKGGMTRGEARFALQSVDLQLHRLGIESIGVSVEDFEEAPAPVAQEPISGGEGGKPVGGENNTTAEPDANAVTDQNVAVSQEAATNVREIITKIWDAIKKALTAMWKAVSGFVMKAVEFSLRQAHIAESLKKDLLSLKDTVIKSEEVELGDLAESLAIEGKLATPADVHVVTELIGVQDKAMGKSLVASLKSQVSGFKAAKTEEEVAAAIAKFEEEQKTFIASNLKAGAHFKVFDNGMKTPVLPGNHFIFITTKDKISVAKTAETGAKPAPAKMAQPKVDLLVKYCDEVVALAKAADGYKKSCGSIEKGFNDLCNAMENSTINTPETNPESAKEVAKVIREASQASAMAGKVITADAVALTKNLNAFVKLCYKNFASAKEITKAAA